MKGDCRTPTSSKPLITAFRRLLGYGSVSQPADSEPPYERWIRECGTLTDQDRQSIVRHIGLFESRPLISVVMAAYDTPERFFRQAIDSVRRQIYPDWELCVADDASSSPHVMNVLAASAERDPRIKWVRRERNGHVCAATNTALDLATGAFVAFMDHDDLLAEQALYEVANEINLCPAADLIYTDEDHVDEIGRRSCPYFKTDWNRELMLGHNLTNHLCVFRRSLIEKVGRFREGFEGAQDYDLALRVVDASSPSKIRHIPAVLYHWRQGDRTFSKNSTERCASAARRAVEDHIARRGEQASVEPHPIEASWQLVRRHPPAFLPLVSLIIRPKQKSNALRPCLEGLLRRTTYKNIEVLIIDHESHEPDGLGVLVDLAKDPRVRILSYRAAFNYAAINNFAVSQAKGEIVGFVSNDIDVIEPHWLAEMVAHAWRPEVGAVGARLLFEDGRVQHAGVMVSVGDIAGHFCKFIGREDSGYFGRAKLASEVTAVTGACLIVRKSVFDEVGGLDAANLVVAFSDVDLCLKIRAKGYVNIFTPSAELYRVGSASRDLDTLPNDDTLFEAAATCMRARWKQELTRDPYYSIHFSPHSQNFDLAFPGRREPPWRDASIGIRTSSP